MSIRICEKNMSESWVFISQFWVYHTILEKKLRQICEIVLRSSEKNQNCEIETLN